MAYAKYFEISVNGVTVHIGDNGFTVGGAEIVDFNQPWLGRSKLIAFRNTAGQIGMNIGNIAGRQIHVRFADAVAGLPNIPVNNDLVLDSMYKKIVRKSFTINGIAMRASAAAGLYGDFLDAQEYWVSRDLLFKKLTTEDIPYIDIDAIVSDYITLVTTPPYINISTPVYDGSAMFAPGASFKAGAYCIDWATDLSFNFVHEEVVDA